MTPETEVAVSIFICTVAALLAAWAWRTSLKHRDQSSDPQTVYLVGRVRIPAGRATVWDVIGVVLTEDDAINACTTKKDFYVPQHIGSLRDDKVVVPAVLTFPLRNKKSAEPKPEAE